MVGCRPAEGGGDKGIEIVEASGRIVFGGVLDAAVRLLPHLVEFMNRIASIRFVGKTGTSQLEGPVREVGTIDDPWIGSSRAGSASGSRGQQEEIGRFQRRFD